MKELSHDERAGPIAPAVEFRNVTISFDGRAALRDVSFTLARGQMICVTGAAASGKSVLLRLAAGLLKPDEGRIFVGGREIETLDEEEMLDVRGRLMGFVSQEESLFTGLTVYENVAFRPAEHRWPEEEADRAVREALSFVGLEEEAEKLPEELSGGMRRRLEIARAVVGWPSIMLCDEPTSGLDPLNASQVLDLVIRARDLRGISSLVVTKQLHQIPYLAMRRAVETARDVEVREADEWDAPGVRVLLLHEGVIAFTGTAAEFAASRLPAVLSLTQAWADKPHAPLNVADPWGRARGRGRGRIKTRAAGSAAREGVN
jgi:phospholipid/cholesterol/gamma-HCH transport system ATP-binding protein